MFDLTVEQKNIRRRLTDFFVWEIDAIDPNQAYIDGQTRYILGYHSTVKMIWLIVVKSILNHKKTESYSLKYSKLQVRHFDTCLEWKQIRKKLEFLKNHGLIECYISTDKKFYTIEPNKHLLALSLKHTKTNLSNLATQISISSRINRIPIGSNIAIRPLCE